MGPINMLNLATFPSVEQRGGVVSFCDRTYVYCRYVMHILTLLPLRSAKTPRCAFLHSITCANQITTLLSVYAFEGTYSFDFHICQPELIDALSQTAILLHLMNNHRLPKMFVAILLAILFIKVFRNEFRIACLKTFISW